MKPEIRVEVFSGSEDDFEDNGLTFFFNSYKKAKQFVDEYVKGSSHYNARIIELYIFSGV
jgi:hypothetical protein